MLVKPGRKIVVGCKVPEAVSEYLFSLLNALSDKQHGVGHAFGPRGEAATAVDDDILQRLESAFGSRFHSEGDLVVNIIIQLIVWSDGFSDFITKVDGSLQ